jgi:hypothetical protein
MIAGSLKIVYDILMLTMFLGYRTQEERAEEQVNEAEEAEREKPTDDPRDVPT